MSVSPASENEATTSNQTVAVLQPERASTTSEMFTQTGEINLEAAAKVIPTASAELQAISLLLKKFAAIVGQPSSSPHEELQAITTLFQKCALTHYQVNVNFSLFNYLL